MMFLTDRMLISTCGVTLQSNFGKLTVNICSRYILNKTKLKMLRDNSSKLVNRRISGTLILKVFEYIVVNLIFFLWRHFLWWHKGVYLLWQRLYLGNDRVMFVSDLFDTVNLTFGACLVFLQETKGGKAHIKVKNSSYSHLYRHKQLNHEGVIYLLLMRGAGL